MASTHRAIFPIDADSLIHFSSPDMLYVPYLCPHHCYPGEFQADKDFVCVSSADTTGPTVVVRYKVYNIHYMKDPTIKSNKSFEEQCAKEASRIENQKWGIRFLEEAELQRVSGCWLGQQL